MAPHAVSAASNAECLWKSIEDRKSVFVGGETCGRLDEFVRRLGGRKMSVSGLIENIARQHLEIYNEDFEQWRKL